MTGFWNLKTALTRSNEDIRGDNSNDPSCIYNYISQNLPHPDPLSFVKEKKMKVDRLGKLSRNFFLYGVITAMHAYQGSLMKSLLNTLSKTYD